MKRVFTELTPECDYTAQLYAKGYEKTEIAKVKIKAVSTINNQLMTAFRILEVKNGRELSIKLAERITGRQIGALILCLFFSYSVSISLFTDIREPRVVRTTQVTRITRRNYDS